MSVYRRGGVYWYEFEFEGQRVRDSAKTSSKTMARDAERQRRRELELGINRITKRERMPLFKLAAEEWLTGKSATSARLTGETYGYFVRSLIKNFGDRLVSDIGHRDIAELQRKRLAEGKSARTVNLEISTLRQVLRAHGLWAPIGERVKHLRERQDVGRAIGRDDEACIFDAIRKSRSPALLPLFTLALDTGLRRSELRALRLRDLALEWQDGLIRKGSLCVPQSKTEAGQGRVVPLTRRACAVLSLWLSRFPMRDRSPTCFPRTESGFQAMTTWLTLTASICRGRWANGKRRGASPSEPPGSVIAGTIAGTASSHGSPKIRPCRRKPFERWPAMSAARCLSATAIFVWRQSRRQSKLSKPPLLRLGPHKIPHNPSRAQTLKPARFGKRL